MFRVKPNTEIIAQGIQLCKQISIQKGESLIYANTQQEKINQLVQTPDGYQIRSFSKNKKTALKFSKEKQNFKEKVIISLYTEESQAFIICRDPFCIFYISCDQINPIILTTNQTIALTQCQCSIKYPLINLYGTNQTLKTNIIMQINLQTLNIKTINQGKGYSPGYRKNFIAIFHHERLYIFGGTDISDRKCEKLVWIYDFENGNLFALQMQYPDEIYEHPIKYHAFGSNKVLITSERMKKMWVFEVYQSRLTQIQSEYSYHGYNLWIESLGTCCNLDEGLERCQLWKQKIYFQPIQHKK